MNIYSTLTDGCGPTIVSVCVCVGGGGGGWGCYPMYRFQQLLVSMQQNVIQVILVLMHMFDITRTVIFQSDVPLLDRSDCCLYTIELTNGPSMISCSR